MRTIVRRRRHHWRIASVCSGFCSAKNGQGLHARMAGEQGRKPGQGRYAQGLRDAVPRGRRGTDSNCSSAPAAAQKTTAAAPAATGQKTVKACIEEWRANKAANEAKGVTLRRPMLRIAAPARRRRNRRCSPRSRNRRGPRQRRRQLRHNRRSRHQGRQPELHLLRQRLRPVQTSTRRKGRPSSAASAERSSGPISIQRSITSAATRPMARPKRARICASGMPRARACAPRKTRSIPEVKERSAAPVT